MGQTQTQPSSMTTQAPPSGMAIQPRPYSGSTQTQGQLPQGSYASSCKDARMDGQTLIAFCQKPDGTWQTSALRTQQCTGDIQDVNGNLICGAANQYSASTLPASPTPQRRY
jgi:CVNH domain